MTARRSTPMVAAVQRSVPRGVERRAIRKGMEAAAGCRAHRDRAGAVRRGRPGGRGVRAADQGEGRRRWRALGLGVVQAFLEADAPRVACPAHGVAVAAVPWARHGAGFTRAFEDTAAWLAVHTSRS